MGERAARRRELRDLNGKWQHANHQASRALAKKRTEVKRKKKLTESEILLLKAAEEKLNRSLRRQQFRRVRYNAKSEQYRALGLNGPRAVARRKRQLDKIAARE